MNCRIMKREEFVARMLADQELRKERKRRAKIEATETICALMHKRQAKYLRDRKLKGR